MSDGLIAPPDLDNIERLLQEGTFEETLDALESVVAHLDQGHLSISEAVDWYEAGLGLSRRCNEILQTAELRVITLDQTFGIAGRDDALWNPEDD